MKLVVPFTNVSIIVLLQIECYIMDTTHPFTKDSLIGKYGIRLHDNFYERDSYNEALYYDVLDESKHNIFLLKFGG